MLILIWYFGQGIGEHLIFGNSALPSLFFFRHEQLWLTVSFRHFNKTF